MAFYKHKTFEDWLASTDFTARYGSIKHVALMAAKEAWDAARANPPKPVEVKPEVLTDLGWRVQQAENDDCTCDNCLARYRAYYGEPR
jgi:hypothetical protein